MDDVKGFVRISNLCYHKIVAVRVTKDNWGTFHDIKAEYFSSDRDFLTDRLILFSLFPVSLWTSAISLYACRQRAEKNFGTAIMEIIINLSLISISYNLTYRFNHAHLSNC